MPTDYDFISNDTDRLVDNLKSAAQLLGSMYTERTHFLLELLQNAEDVEATEIRFHLFHDRLEVHHNGKRLFDQADVTEICSVAGRSKEGDLTKIGRFGIGFKSVYAYTTRPEIHSGEEHFYIEDYVYPRQEHHYKYRPDWTSFLLPFNKEDLDQQQAYAEIAERLETLGSRTLLFLRSIEQVSWSTPEASGTYVRRSQPEKPTGSGLLARIVDLKHQSSDEYERWLVFSRPTAYSDFELRVEVGFLLRQAEGDNWEITPVPETESQLVVFFPTDKNTHLGCLIQGPFRTTPARDNIPSDDEFNQLLARETGELLVQALLVLREKGLLTISVLECMPLKGIEFVNTIFAPLYERVRNAFFEHPLLPADSGGNVTATQARLARGAELIDLLSDEVLSQFVGSDTPLFWLSRKISESSPLWRYLSDNLDIPIIRPETFAGAVSEAFLAQQSDEWMIQFYQYLSDRKDLWKPPARRFQGGVLRNKPIIRLEDGQHRIPFDEDGSPQVFLPGDYETDFPTVRQVLCNDKEALEFLKELGLSVPNLIDEVERRVLPQYENSSLLEPPDSYWRDLDRILRALRGDGDRQRRLTERLEDVCFIYAINAGNGDLALQSPGTVYVYSGELAEYFQHNVEVWFVDEDILDFAEERGFLAEFRKLGISAEVRIDEGGREPDRSGRVVFKHSHGDHARGLDRFNPMVSAEGLKCALEHITYNKARYIWNELLPRIRDSIRGVVETSTTKHYGEREREERLSEAGELLVNYRWLPDRDGQFHYPHELTLDDLPDDFERDETLARQLGMLGDQIKESADRLGIPEELLRELTSDPDVAKDVQEFLKKRAKSGSTPSETTYAEEVQRAFERPGKPVNADDVSPEPPAAQNLDRRRERIREEIEEAIEQGDSSDGRAGVRVVRRRSPKEEYIRTYLLEEYRGRCQMDGKTFHTAAGPPYFEAVPLVNRTYADWVDRPGNYLCLSADFAARWQHGAKPTEENIITQVLTADEQNPVLRIQLCGEDVEIRYAPKHFLELQEMVRTSYPEGKSYTDPKDS